MKKKALKFHIRCKKKFGNHLEDFRVRMRQPLLARWRYVVNTGVGVGFAATWPLTQITATDTHLKEGLFRSKLASYDNTATAR